MNSKVPGRESERERDREGERERRLKAFTTRGVKSDERWRYRRGMKRLKRLSSEGAHNRPTERHIFTVRGTRWNKIQLQSTAEDYSASHTQKKHNSQKPE